MSVKDNMSISERAAYLKGLSEGLDLDTSKPEGKLIEAMLDLIYDMSDEITFIEEDVQFLTEQNDELFDIIDEIGYEDYEDYDDESDYEVKCPDCGAEIVVDEDTLIEGEMNCPNCGGELEFDFSSLFADEFCDDDCANCNVEGCEIKDE
ncbi:MAG: hypothetical protein VZQ55_01765 [Ruminococcus sp.]|jgi:DNA-directed RNA polymerase subunit RPC12/RpoP|nr:hypothetical protein [Ruminococcus sp.]